MSDIAVIGATKTFEVIGMCDGAGKPYTVDIEAVKFGMGAPGTIGFMNAKDEIVAIVPASLIVRVKRQ